MSLLEDFPVVSSLVVPTSKHPIECPLELPMAPIYATTVSSAVTSLEPFLPYKDFKYQY